VFFSVRRKRSPRATFLVSEETRLSRSTVTPKSRLDAGQDLGDVEWGAGLLKYVIGHVYLGQTSSAGRVGWRSLALAQPADGAQLRFQRGFKCGEDQIFEVIIHGGLSMGSAAAA